MNETPNCSFRSLLNFLIRWMGVAYSSLKNNMVLYSTVVFKNLSHFHKMGVLNRTLDVSYLYFTLEESLL